jgi:hypothetical protein
MRHGVFWKLSLQKEKNTKINAHMITEFNFKDHQFN